MKKKYQQGFGIMAIIAIIAALFGVGGVLYYVQSNQATLEPIVEQVKEERKQQAQENGYPEIWIEDGLPQYPSGELTKVRDMGNVTIETSDTPAQVKTFFDSEMASRGFATGMTTNTELVSFTMYSKGTAGLTAQSTVQEDNGLTKIVLLYHR